ncbi:MAG: nitronate monooxygenase [Congregibacter sp.]
MLSLDVPIVQAPMAGVHDGALTIAVAQAGGLGSLPCAMLSTPALLKELESFNAAGVKTYNLNFFCHEPPAPDPRKEALWRQALAPYYEELGIDPEIDVSAPSRAPFSNEFLELIRPFAPAVVSFHFGLPQIAWLDEIKAWGGQVWSSATSLEEAHWLVEHGADAIIAQGIEAGGHRGMFLSQDLSDQADTYGLLRQIVEEIHNVPVIAAGGIAGPEQVKRLIDAGASAVQVGTAYLCCDEATTSDAHRKLLLSPESKNTALTNLLSGRPARGIMNRLMRELGPMSDLAPDFPLASVALAPLRGAAEKAQRSDFSPLWCGTDASGCRQVSAAKQTRWLASALT